MLYFLYGTVYAMACYLEYSLFLRFVNHFKRALLAEDSLSALRFSVMFVMNKHTTGRFTTPRDPYWRESEINARSI